MNRYAIAPMMEVTNTHFRTFIRLLSKKATNYTEMIHCNTLKFNPDKDRFLKFNPVEKPIVL